MLTKFQKEFTINDEAFWSKTFTEPWFDSEKTNDINIDELLDIQHDQLSSRVGRQT